MRGKYRAVIAGSGSAAFAEPFVCDLVVAAALRSRHARAGAAAAAPAATEQQPPPIRVAYLGTATYDSDISRDAQTSQLALKGCLVTSINVTWPSSTQPAAALREIVLASDVVLVSGGNTLYAIQRWKECGIDAILAEAAALGIVLAGGSAGAICWFDGGHSDSADPSSFRKPRRPAATGTAPADADIEQPPPAAALPTPSAWQYIRVSALGLFPGLMCPHHDRTQSNGIPRYLDFERMLRQHPGERGICLDHWCALVVEGSEYAVHGVPGKGGSVRYDGGAESAAHATFVTDDSGVPGMWVKEVVASPPLGTETSEGASDASGKAVHRIAVPRAGQVEALFRAATVIDAEAAKEANVMRQNPTSEA